MIFYGLLFVKPEHIGMRPRLQIQGKEKSQLQKKHQQDRPDVIGRSKVKDPDLHSQASLVKMRKDMGEKVWEYRQKPEHSIADPIGTNQMHPTLGAVGKSVGG